MNKERKTIKDLKVGDNCYRIYDFNLTFKKLHCISNNPIGKQTGSLLDKHDVTFITEENVELQMTIESYRPFIIDRIGTIFLDKESAIEHLKWKIEDVNKTIQKIEES